MGAEEVIQKILADAKAEAQKIKKQADENAAAEKAKLDEQLKDYKKQTELLAKKAAEDKELHLLASARMDITKALLTEKRKILDDLFSEAQKRLISLPDEEYRKLIVKLMLDAVETGDEEVIIDNNESRIDQNLIDKVNAEGKKNLKLAKQRLDLAGGFILKRGKIKNNVTLGVLINQARNELEIKLAKEIFS